MSIHSKKDLELVLSKLKQFTEPSWELEQYATPADIAADWIWNMALKAEISGRVCLDSASGPGILGIALLLMGAKKVYFLDSDKEAIKICMENYQLIKGEYELGKAEFIIEDISLFDQKVDLVVQNPPFGVKKEHADKKFLEKAFIITNLIYSMHKWSTKIFIESIAKDNNFRVSSFWRYDFKIKSVFKFHQKPVKSVEVVLWRLEKLQQS